MEMISANFKKILFFLIFSYLLGLGSWLLIHGKMKLFVNESTSKKSDTRFIAHMERSLTVIDRKNLTAKEEKTNNKEQSESKKNISVFPITQLPNNPFLSPLPTSPLPPPPPPASTSQEKPYLSSMPQVAPKVESKPSSKLILVGLIESGKSSIALFSLNGNIEQIKIGQPISSTAWTLVSIANQQAIIQKNGNLYSISVGQKF